MDLINSGVNIVAYKKYGKLLGMTCAWMMQVGYDEIYMLLGDQSDTGNNIEKKDIIGISALSSNQKNIALQLGENHSLTKNKFENIDIDVNNMCILINNAKTQMKCEVIDILHPLGNKTDRIIHVRVLDSKIDENAKFLSMSDMR